VFASQSSTPYAAILHPDLRHCPSAAHAVCQLLPAGSTASPLFRGVDFEPDLGSRPNHSSGVFIGGRSGQWSGGTMASAEHEPITGVWGRAPSGVQGQSPWSGGQGAESIWVIGCLTEPANLALFQKCPFELYALLRSTGIRVGGPRVHGAPNPVIGGPVPPGLPGSAAYGCVGSNPLASPTKFCQAGKVLNEWKSSQSGTAKLNCIKMCRRSTLSPDRLQR